MSSTLFMNMRERKCLMDQPATKIQGYIWNPQAEQMPPAELAALQAQRLQQQGTRAYELVPFYRRALDESRGHPPNIRALDDIELLPFHLQKYLLTPIPFELFPLTLYNLVV